MLNNSLKTIDCFWESDFLSQCQKSLFQVPFWDETGNGSGEVKPLKHDNATRYLSMLSSLGFCQIHDHKSDSFVLVQMKNSMVRRVDENDIREFIVYLFNNSQNPIGISVLDQMTIKYSQFFGRNNLTSLRLKQGMTPLKDTRSTSYRFFRNCIVKISGESISTIEYSSLDDNQYVHIENILGRDFVTPDTYMTEEEFLEDKTRLTGHHFYRWCQNLCRFKDGNDWKYDVQSFKSLVSGFGYLLHRAWNESKIVVFTDKDMVSGVSNGRTGKSVVLNEAMENAVNTVVVNAKNISKMNSDRFLFSEVERDTDYICFDDGTNDFPLERLFSNITGNLQVEKKNANKYTIHRKDKPKMALSCNHPILGDGFSFEDRQHLVEVSDFYRYQKQEHYTDPVKIHGGYLFDEDWGDQNWQEFDEFCIYALRYYLKHGLVGGRASESYRLAKLQNEVGSKELVSVLHRFIEENVDKTIYRNKTEGMNDEPVLLETVQSLVDINLSSNRIVSSFRKVANHFGYRINDGNGSRQQCRVGGEKVDKYHISRSSNPFPRSCKQ